MKIAVASGKGGTGKTTVAVNLALSLRKCTLIDCDVEEPNCAIFLNTCMQELEEVRLPVPVFDLDRCTHCGKCAEFCMYNAIAVFPEKLLFFKDICHSCGGCAILCPEGAVSETTRRIGEIDHARIAELDVYQGKMDVGEPLAVPIIRRLKEYTEGSSVVIYDSPPGTACPVIETLNDADVALLVTEPTPFGLHDLKIAVEVARKLDVPFGVIINREGVGDDRVDRYCEDEGIEIIMRIPNDRRIAELYSKGIPFILELQEYREAFLQAYWEIYHMAGARP